MVYRDAAWEYREAGWLGVIPLPARAKAPVPKGWTGHDGGWPSGADIQAWCDGPEGDGNIALRLPPDIIGLDIDAYNGKQGAQTITDAVQNWGSLPLTWRSTNRESGQGSILLFRVPPGMLWPGELGPGIEIIQFAHRYLVAPPSIHPEGRTYHWVSPDGAPTMCPPEPADLPDLPESWLAGITGMQHAGEHPHAGFTGEEVSGWLNKYGGEWPCEDMKRAIGSYEHRFTDGGSRHEAARDAVRRIIALTAEGHRGGVVALENIQGRFEQAIAADPSRPRDRGEFRRMVDGAVQLVGTRMVPPHDPCFAPAAVPYVEVSAARSGRLINVHNGTYLNNTTFPPLRYAISNLVPEGLVLLVGAPKIGKSFLALDWGLARGYGGKAMSTIPVMPGPVFYLALEDGDRRMQQRCRTLLGDDPIPAAFEYIVDVQPTELLGTIGDWLSEHRHDQPLVILDTLGKVTPPAASGETTYQRDYRIAGELKRLIDSAPGGSLVVNHHDRKQAAQDFIDAVSGTHGLAGAADTTIVVVRDRLSPDGLLKVTGRDVREDQYAVNFEAGRWTLDGLDLMDASAAAAQRSAIAGLGENSMEVVRYVIDHPGSSPFEVADALSLTPKIAQQILGRLVKAGRLIKPARGVYFPLRSEGSEGLTASEDATDSQTLKPSLSWQLRPEPSPEAEPSQPSDPSLPFEPGEEP